MSASSLGSDQVHLDQALTVLNQIGQTLVTIDDLPQTLGNIAQKASEVLGAEIVDLYEYIQARGEVVLPPVLVGERWHPHVPKTKIYEDDVVMQVIKERQPQYFLEAQKAAPLTGRFEVARSDAPAQRFVIREGVVSAATIPLLAAEETVGVMFVNYRLPQTFDLEQQALIESFASLAAIAIHNARLFQAEHARRLQSETLKEVARIVNSAHTLEEVVKTVFEQLHRVLEYEGASIQLVVGDRRKPIGGRGWQERVERYPEVLLRNVSEDRLIGKIVQTRQPLVLSDVKAESLWEYFPETEQVKSWIGIPLVFGEQVVGLLILEHGQTGYYTESSGAVAEAFANQVAMAIHNSAQAQALTELSKLAQRLGSINASPENTQELLEQIAGSAQEVLKADFVAIYEYLQWRNEVKPMPAFAGLRQGPDVPKPEIKKDDVIWTLIAESKGKPLYIVDVPSSEFFFRPFIERPHGWPDERFAIREKIISTAFLPLKINNEIVGFLYVSYRVPQMFAAEQRELVELFAGQAAIALKNARRVRALRVLNDLGQRLSSRLQEREILEAIHQYAGELMDTSNMYIALYAEASRMVRFGLRYDEGSPSSMEPRVGGKGRTEAIIQSREPLLLVTKAAVAKWYEEYPGYRERKFASYVGVPMMVSGKVLGVIATFHPEREYLYTQDDLALLQAFASQAAIALDNARLFTARGALVKFGQALTSGIRLNEPEILHLVHQQASTLMDTNNMYIALYDEAQDAVRFGLALQNGEPVQVNSRKINDANRGRTEEIIRTQKFLFHPARIDGERWYAQPGHAEYIGDVLSCWIGVPILLGEKVLGVIATYHPTQDFVYNENDLEVLQEIAAQAAVALDNARLFYSANRKLEALVEFGQKLASSTRLKEDEILSLIHQQASTLMDTNNMYIALYDEAQDAVRFGLALQNGEPVQVNSRKIDDANRGRTEEIIRTQKFLFHPARIDGERWYAQPGHAEFIGSMLPSWIGVPILLGEKVLGVIATYHPTQDFVYNENDLEVLQEIAAQAAVALDNARLFQELMGAQQRIAEVEQTMTRTFIATDFVHRMNNLAGTIPVWTERFRDYLGAKGHLDTKAAEYLNNISSDARHLLSAAEQLKHFPVKTKVEINDMLTSLVSQVRIQTPPSIQVDISVMDEPLTVYAIPSELSNALWSIIENGIEAMPNRGTLTVVAKDLRSQGQQQIEILVRDEGGGISPDLSQSLFAPFRSDKPGHMGYGLWRARNIVENIGGTVNYTSEIGVGTCFTITLPLFQEGARHD